MTRSALRTSQKILGNGGRTPPYGERHQENTASLDTPLTPVQTRMEVLENPLPPTLTKQRETQ